MIRLILFFLIINASCSNSADKVTLQDDISIEYKAQTRGSFYTIRVEDANLVLNTSTFSKTVNLSEEDLQKLKQEISNINLDTIHDLEAPTNKRLTDGAMSASFTFTQNNAVFTSAEFDHQHPPEELKPLFALLTKLAS